MTSRLEQVRRVGRAWADELWRDRAPELRRYGLPSGFGSTEHAARLTEASDAEQLAREIRIADSSARERWYAITLREERRIQRRAAAFASEAELATAIVEHLRSSGHEVYQEVVGFGGVADIVATKDGRIIVVECKLYLGLDVMEQACRWKLASHETYVATPEPSGLFPVTVCKKLGLGVMLARKRHSFDDGALITEVDVREQAEARTEVSDANMPRLCVEQQTYAAAGSATGKHWSPFRATEKALREYVAEHPGVLCREALKAIPHHWNGKGAPTSRVRELIGKGAITGIRIDDTNGVRLYPIAAEEQRT